MKRRIKINGVIIFLATVLIAAFPSLFIHTASEGLQGLVEDILGIALILSGQILRVSARGYKAEYSGQGKLLVQTGPYAIVRNPMYLGILLIGTGIVLVLFRLWVGVIFIIVFTFRYLLLIFKEEKKLLVLFPKEYPAYQKRVPRIKPSFTFLLEKDITEYLPLKFVWLKKEIGTILAVLLATFLLEAWQDIKTVGIRAFSEETAAIIITILLFMGLVIYLNMRTESLAKDVSAKS